MNIVNSNADLRSMSVTITSDKNSTSVTMPCTCAAGQTTEGNNSASSDSTATTARSQRIRKLTNKMVESKSFEDDITTGMDSLNDRTVTVTPAAARYIQQLVDDDNDDRLDPAFNIDAQNNKQHARVSYDSDDNEMPRTTGASKKRAFKKAPVRGGVRKSINTSNSSHAKSVGKRASKKVKAVPKKKSPMLTRRTAAVKTNSKTIERSSNSGNVVIAEIDDVNIVRE